MCLEQLLAVANTEREVGNDFFQQNITGKAVGKYLKVCGCGCGWVGVCVWGGGGRNDFF